MFPSFMNKYKGEKTWHIPLLIFLTRSSGKQLWRKSSSKASAKGPGFVSGEKPPLTQRHQSLADSIFLFGVCYEELLLFPHQDTHSQSTRVMSVTRKRCLRGDREGTTSHSPLSLHRWDVTLLVEGSGASITAEECSYIPAHLTLIWVLHLERRTSVSLGDETHRATTVAILNVGPLYVSARTWMRLPGTIRNIMECKMHNKTFCSPVKFERRGPWTIFLVNQRSRHRKAAKKTLFTQSGYFSYDVDKINFWSKY